MAARFVVGLALFALCHSSPVLINEIRDGRALSIANGMATGFGGENKASAHVQRNVAQATGTTNGAGFVREGLYPSQGQAIANAQTYDSADQAAINIARAQGFYHPQPAVVTYNQFPAEQLVYHPVAVAPGSAESSATTNGASESSHATATNNGPGAAESNAHTAGNYGLTTTNAKTYGGYNTAVSDANTGLGQASVSSKASGSGIGNSFASSNALANRAVGFAPIPSEVIIQPSDITTRNEGFYNPALHGSASSNAKADGFSSASSSARTGPARRSISWRFGTAYDTPAGYGSFKAAAPVVYQPAPIVYQPARVVYNAVPVEVNPYGTVRSSANSQNSGSAQNTANLNAGFGSSRSTANSNAGGSAGAVGSINNFGSGLYRSGVANTVVNTNGQGFADSNANLSNGASIVQSAANSAGGHAKSNADNRGFGLYRTVGEGTQYGRTVSDAEANGFGKAQSSAQGYPSGQKSADSYANSNGWGSAIANSQSL